MPTTALLLLLCLSRVSSTRQGDPIRSLNFRPPAIPLFTTDPFTQTWMRGDNSSAAHVTHWDGAEKQMAGLVRVDGTTYRWLGACTPTPVTKPGPLLQGPLQDTNISPGSHDIANSPDKGADDCNVRCFNSPACVGFVLATGNCYLKSSVETTPVKGATSYVIDAAKKPTCERAHAALRQRAVTALPTRTVFELELPGILALNATFLQTLFTDDYARLSRPVYYLTVDVAALDGKQHDVSLYFDASAQHAVNTETQQVQWEAWSGAAGFDGVRIGNAEQNVLGSKGDRVNIDWGYLP